MAVTRSRVVDQEPGAKKLSATAPPPATEKPKKEETTAKPKMIAKVHLIIGASNTSHGRQWFAHRPQTIVDEALITELKNDGNFSVEMVPVAGGRPASTK